MISPYTVPGLIDNKSPLKFILSLPLHNESQVLQFCADAYNITPEQITGKAKPTDAVLARQLAAYIFTYLFKYTLYYTATILYPISQNHSNVHYAKNKFAQDWEIDKTIRHRIITAAEKLSCSNNKNNNHN